MTRSMITAALLGLAPVLVPTTPAQADPPARSSQIVIRPAAPTGTPSPAPDASSLERIARAQANYAALTRGDISVRDLTAQDLQDIVDLDRALREGQPDARTFAEKCIDDEVRRAGGRPSRLAWQVIELKCRELGGQV